MAIQLSPEQERVVDQAIHAGLIRIPEDVVGVGVETIRQRLESKKLFFSPKNNDLGPADWSHELHVWIHSHSGNASPLPDEALSRESIYQDRGL